MATMGKDDLPEMMTSIRVVEGKIEIVDQLLLPHQVQWLPINSPDEAYDAIKSMKIRGAPAIASLAALSLHSYLSSPTLPPFTTPDNVAQHLLPILDHLQSSRPTAVNLSEAMNRIRAVLRHTHSKSAESSEPDKAVQKIMEKVKKVCMAVHDEDLVRNLDMSRNGAMWFWMNRREGKKKLKILTVCNTGSLATSGYGTALGVITALFQAGQLDTAYYAQTTPYHQGSRLTSLELTTLKIPACMICDTMIGSLMQLHDIDGVVVGADRIVANGDTANKIGTYQAAVLAQRHKVPFMVVAPVTTVDRSLKTGNEIHIEQRPPIEATQVRGRDISTGQLSVVRITPEGVGEDDKPWNGVYNPSFDVTPAELISCVVTEKGVAERQEGENSIDVASVC
ncbi:methylthioribose-1-phosphate isomerase [Tremella mesenterica]|uniref:Methylthioribose-1-phosphate isomerase n=1 Tax=Tremella mesenterica TaxID=5217 RepID=A0A4Q1BAD0_TREME|nr:methylthioribose-1-phosphate isomerase [Tremella mesenterica]